MNKKTELISIIIPCYNSGRTIKRTIDSIKKQTWKEKEIIVVNDGSTDEYTLRILLEIDGLVIINQKNLGLSAARNVGAYKASGKFLFFLDSDDWIEDNALELMFNYLIRNGENNYVYSDIILEGNIKKIVRKNYNFFEQLFLNQIPYAIFISKNTWLRNKGYDKNMILGYEDWEFNIRLGAKNIFGIRLPVPLFHYTVSNSGMLISKSSKYHTNIWNYIKERNPEVYKINKILKYWMFWRKKSSSYPLLIFCFWYLLYNFLPNRISSILFLLFRNIKWFFTRNKFFKFNKF